MKRSSISWKPAVILHGGHELCAESGLLARRVDGDETEMGALAARLDEGTGDQFAFVFEEQEFSAVENFAKRVGVDALAFDVGTLGDKGGVDEADERGDVFGTREAEDRGHGDILRGIVVHVSEGKEGDSSWLASLTRRSDKSSKRGIKEPRNGEIEKVRYSFFSRRSSEVGWMPRMRAAWVLLLPVAVRTCWM